MRVPPTVRIPEPRPREDVRMRPDRREDFRKDLSAAGEAPPLPPPPPGPVATIQIPPRTPTTPVIVAPTTSVDIEALSAPLVPALPPALVAPSTPLEQAIQELLSTFAEAMPEDVDGPLDETTVAEVPLPVLGASPKAVELDRATPAVAAVPTLAAPTETPEAAVAQSHVHLVVDDPAGERIVVTVAVRGTDVHVAMRGSDDTAAALARNAATLDHNLRVRGLDLAGLDIQQEAPRDHSRPDRERDEGAPDDPLFVLQEAS